MRKKLPPSEFEGKGPWPFGGYGVERATEKLRLIYRTGQDPDAGVVSLTASPDDWGTGGLREFTETREEPVTAQLQDPATYRDKRITYRGEVT